MSTNFGAGFHVAPGRAVDASAYDRFTGRWSRLFVPTVLAAAEVAPGCRVLDICTGTGEAALMTLPIIGASGFVIGADISSAMLEGARNRLIGIGGHLAMPPLPHHRAYGSVPRRFDWVRLVQRHRVGGDGVRRNSGCAGLVGPPGVRTCARTPSVNRRRPLHGTLARHDGAVL
jgi:SAM-dependent methyltransferase